MNVAEQLKSDVYVVHTYIYLLLAKLSFIQKKILFLFRKRRLSRHCLVVKKTKCITLSRNGKTNKKQFYSNENSDD